MRMTRKLAAAVGGIALTGGLLAGGAGAAGAAEAAPAAAADCPSGWYCVWSGENYTGRMQKVEGNNTDLTGFSVFQGFKSRYQHGKSCDFKWYSEKNYKGSSGVIKRGAKLTGSTTHFIKSNKWVNCV
ncbi:peptidase inhibitor family I36 protein [Streptomyces sp. NBC_01005]|uniref:peptidase inhibitor family I36 protein n=1 Tax=unclassified Streptomyces TaxID=2593676 RepID=UPI00386F4954|nr:peptidase inhibitor family I36 protein [Streptomyces sp. NBC_01005]WTC95311.1 peptidase inhibitor family I36 protein [Streptomyces sp. NBC_01650]